MDDDAVCSRLKEMRLRDETRFRCSARRLGVRVEARYSRRRTNTRNNGPPRARSTRTPRPAQNGRERRRRASWHDPHGSTAGTRRSLVYVNHGPRLEALRPRRPPFGGKGRTRKCVYNTGQLLTAKDAFGRAQAGSHARSAEDARSRSRRKK